jgi:epoxyqueuosine reductase
MGNALASPKVDATEKNLIQKALSESLSSADALVAEHIEWALKPYN